MKVTVDISDFYLEEGELESELKKYITNQVVATVTESLKKQVELKLELETKNKIKEQLDQLISDTLDSCIKNNKVKAYSGSDLVTIQQYIRDMFERGSGWNNPNDKIEKLAKGFSEELKKRYDLMFASQIVIKLNEQGMLKDEVMKLLIPSIK